jgi:hypothetical protein
VSTTPLPRADPWCSPDVEKVEGVSQTPLPAHLTLGKSGALLLSRAADSSPESGELPATFV